jgi:hypothetical protein
MEDRASSDTGCVADCSEFLKSFAFLTKHGDGRRGSGVPFEQHRARRSAALPLALAEPQFARSSPESWAKNLTHPPTLTHPLVCREVCPPSPIRARHLQQDGLRRRRGGAHVPAGAQSPSGISGLTGTLHLFPGPCPPYHHHRAWRYSVPSKARSIRDPLRRLARGDPHRATHTYPNPGPPPMRRTLHSRPQRGAFTSVRQAPPRRPSAPIAERGELQALTNPTLALTGRCIPGL